MLGIAKAGRGSIVAFGDSDCLDTAYKGGDCIGLFSRIIDHAIDVTTKPDFSKLFRNSHVLKIAIESSASHFGKPASQTPLSFRKLFVSHSRTLARTESDPATSRTDLSFRHLEDVCRSRAQRTVSVRRGHSLDRSNSVKMDSRHRAEPVGSEYRYYDSIPFSKESEMYYRYPHTKGVRISTGAVKALTNRMARERANLFRASAMLVGGMCLMIASIFFRLNVCKKVSNRLWRFKKSSRSPHRGLAAYIGSRSHSTHCS